MRRLAAGLAGLLVSSLSFAGDLRVETWVQDANGARVKTAAEIFIDGESTGLFTPSVVKDVKAGRHLVELRHGCAVAKENIEISAIGKTHLEVDLRAQMATVTIQLKPPGALLQMDGKPFKPAGEEGNRIACGDHTLLASLEGHKTVLTNVNLAPGEIQDIDIELIPLGQGTLSLWVKPDQAVVFLDGTEVGSGNLAPTKIYQGPHVIEARLDGYSPYQEAILIGGNEEIERSIQLLPQPAVATQNPQKASAQPLFTSRTKAAGYSLSAVGSGVLVYGAVQLLQTMSAYNEYKERVDTVNAGLQEPAYAKDFYLTEVDSRVPKMYATLGLGAATLSGGLTLAIRF